MRRLRVIAGTARGRKLADVPGTGTRPITDRAKESLFNILNPALPGGAFFDVFAGTGAVGIEALSRGAAFARFNDNSRAAVRTIRENLAHTGFEAQAEVKQGDAFAQLGRRPDRSFDYVYLAPPQYKGMWRDAIEGLDRQPDWLVADGWAIVQIDPREYEAVELTNLEEFDQRKYGNTLLVFYERKEDDDG
ncbi:MAG: 16S rRNA (guanine(966)-N(2))-methyltransferase RsmD [Anaerolineae bacterium]|nr:MAG: 16S rRNA (guanine(966)-N(2))-methyltransferase RsmD [Anaerolineae bacterium]